MTIEEQSEAIVKWLKVHDEELWRDNLTLSAALSRCERELGLCELGEWPKCSRRRFSTLAKGNCRFYRNLKHLKPTPSRTNTEKGWMRVSRGVKSHADEIRGLPLDIAVAILRSHKVPVNENTLQNCNAWNEVMS